MVLLLSACGGRSKTSSALNGEIIPLKYAENLTLIQGDGYTEARLRNPWDTTSILRTYILIDKDSQVPEHLPTGTIVRTPLQKALVEQALPDMERSRTLIVGDSLTSDIRGGIAFGIDTCWYNPNRKERPKDMDITYVVHSFDEVYRIITES